MTKRKREVTEHTANGQPRKVQAKEVSQDSRDTVTVQIIAGSYERVLHGFTATIVYPHEEGPGAVQDDGVSSSLSVQFADTFLFNAHASAIRCLALSPLPVHDISQPSQITLASGGTDERINLYSLSASPPTNDEKLPSFPTMAGSKILENPKNRELGSLLHHSSSITALYFPTRSKLLSAAEDNTVSITRTKDWSVVSTVRAPIPKAQGRPSGDTAPLGAVPAGINDFAVHPSMKLMVSVGRGEKCLRLWNLVTGKMAGVLNFGKELLQSLKEGKYSSGEGRRIEWNCKGEEFAVAFERGAAIFGMDSKPKWTILPDPLSKLHQTRYLRVSQTPSEPEDLLALSTEDGRIVFYSTNDTTLQGQKEGYPGLKIPPAQLRGQLGGKAAGHSSRIKDFEVLSLPSPERGQDDFLIISGSSDGAIRVWTLNAKELRSVEVVANGNSSQSGVHNARNGASGQVGKLLGTYETGSRITCIKSFVMMNYREDVDIMDDTADDSSNDSVAAGREESGDSESESE